MGLKLEFGRLPTEGICKRGEPNIGISAELSGSCPKTARPGGGHCARRFGHGLLVRRFRRWAAEDGVHSAPKILSCGHEVPAFHCQVSPRLTH